MGIINDLKAVKAVQKLKKGETVKLSIAQITGLLINLIDANKNLSKEQYNKIYKIYSELRNCNTKMELDLNGYYETAIDIIKKFDKIAPYEKYSGGNETEIGFLMSEIRSNNKKNDNSKIKSYKDIEKAEICILIFNKSIRFRNAFTELLNESDIFQKYCNIEPDIDLYNLAHIKFTCLCYSIMTYNLRNYLNNDELDLIRDSLIFVDLGKESVSLGKDWVLFGKKIANYYELNLDNNEDVDPEKISTVFAYEIITEKNMNKISKNDEKDEFTDFYNDLFILFSIINNEEYDLSIIRPNIDKTESIDNFLKAFKELNKKK